MDKSDTIASYSHTMTMNERKTLVITGVKKIENFDEEEFLMNTTMGYLSVKGSNLEMIKLDTYQGNVSIKGKINSFIYVDEKDKKDKQEGIFNKLFKWWD